MVLEDIESMWQAFVGAVIRFWNNRFQQNDEIIWLRSELDRMRNDYKELVKSVNAFEIPKPPEEPDYDELKPIGGTRFVPFHVKRAQLERESKYKADQLRKEAAMAIKSTEQLEMELGIDDGIS